MKYWNYFVITVLVAVFAWVVIWLKTKLDKLNRKIWNIKALSSTKRNEIIDRNIIAIDGISFLVIPASLCVMRKFKKVSRITIDHMEPKNKEFPSIVADKPSPSVKEKAA